MQIRQWPSVAALAITALCLAACTSVAPTVNEEARQVLAPTGKLRIVVYQGSPTSLVRDPVSGETKGVALDLGKAFAMRLGVPLEVMEFPKNAEALDAMKAGRADFAFTNATAVRARDMDFSPTVLEIEQGYLVPANSLLTVATIDRVGTRVGVSPGSTSEGMLRRELRAATLTSVPTLKAAIEMLSAGNLDAFATNKAILFEMSDGLPGSRVLAGRYGLESLAIGIPKGREAGMDVLRRFVEEARADGLVKRAVERAGLRGTAEPTARQ